MDRPRLAILIPAYCEAGTIGPIVAVAKSFGTVIVVDDCSWDETGLVASRNGALVFRNETNRGYDGTLNRAFEEAAAGGFSAVVTMDADGEHDPMVLAAYRFHLQEKSVPLVLGIRKRKQRFSEVVMGAYIKHRFGVEDILCGMKGYNMRLWHENGGFDHTKSIGTELALNSIRRRTPFVQIPIYGVQRIDAPRFGRIFRANWRVFSALFRILLQGAKVPSIVVKSAQSCE